ncbi:MAG: DNA-binding transcriptional LysR family regulator, partial [Gammaproteobacteria bacterium]
HENIEVRLIATNHVLDMLNDHIDLGIKIAPLAAEEVMMTPVGMMRLVVCASPEYLIESGEPLSPKDISDYETITFSRSCDQVPWSFKAPVNQRADIHLKSKLIVNSAEAAVDSAMLGAGLTQVYLYQAAHEIESGEFKVVLQDFETKAVPVCLGWPKGLNSPQKVKAFIEFAKPILEQQLQTLNRIQTQKE